VCDRGNDVEIWMWERGEREQVLGGRRREKVQDVPRGGREDRAHGECIRRNERNEGKGDGEILSEDGQEIGWMKEIWKRRERIEKERVGDRKNVNFWNCIFVCN
jgi:hypothetical protein